MSDDYIRLVKQGDTARRVFTLPPSSANRGVMRVAGDLSWRARIQNIAIINNKIVLFSRVRELNISGNFRTQANISWANRQPVLQHMYAQGMNGQYMGPETGTLFSYGPAITSLEYDGSPYAYDRQGKLVPAGTGNGQRAKAYNNSILRHGLSVNNDLTLRIAYNGLRENPWIMDINAGLQNDKSIIQQNNNQHQQAGIALSHAIKKTKVTANYDYTNEQYDYSNRNGFLNRVYQYSLLTPVSFQNAQGTMIGATQRSYSIGADNPLFLLQQKENGYWREQHQANLKVESDGYSKIKYSLVPTFQHTRTSHTEAYAAGTTGFADGYITRREQADRSFLLKGNASHSFRISGRISSTLDVDYNYTGIHTDIQYRQLADYQYGRRVHEPSLHYNTTLNLSGLINSVSLQLGQKTYISSTADRTNYWLPDIALGISLDPEVADERLSIFVRTRISQFNSELPLNRSVAALNLLNYTTNTLPSFAPTKEVNSFQQLRPIEHMEWANNLYLEYMGFNFTAYHYIRHTFHDVLPILTNNTIQLKNIAGHKVQGYELTLSHNTSRTRGSLLFINTLSFTTYRNQINHVSEGYNYTPVAGLSNVHSAIVKGAPVNAIVGTAFLRDAKNQVITAADGTPLADPQQKVIGDPNPDFVFNLNNQVKYKSFGLSLVWQWSKGGQMWNGTQAILDQYGRSINRTPYSSIAEYYVQRADYVRLCSATLSMTRNFYGFVNKLRLSAFVNNILLWTPYKGVSPTQSLLDQSNANGLDLFNLPATANAGITATISF